MSPVPSPGVTVRAPGKINLALRVGPRRADGYHPLATVFQAVSVYEDVTASPADALVLTV
ncbi:MAG TPA: 4-(cytidine 5'-diphospho)-2-C-methyl-D-erythritol kinase, partial [Actinotalea sp.]|nr:4-(cytidine 5'-diphospho)-2-C-methyl-D-erythritol kinase [Actinotalea sp.]